jgi:FtsP/CotA-like multicopper oxidase with cupredoxin domain
LVALQLQVSDPKISLGQSLQNDSPDAITLNHTDPDGNISQSTTLQPWKSFRPSAAGSWDIVGGGATRTLTVDEAVTTSAVKDLASAGILGNARIESLLDNPIGPVLDGVPYRVRDIYEIINRDYLTCNIKYQYDDNIIKYTTLIYNTINDKSYVKRIVNYPSTYGLTLSHLCGAIGYVVGRKKGCANFELGKYVRNFYAGVVQAGKLGHLNRRAIVCAIGYADYLRPTTSVTEEYGTYYDNTPYSSGVVHTMEWEVKSEKWDYGENLGSQWSLVIHEDGGAGTVPGPLVRANVGDIVNIKVTNQIEAAVNYVDSLMEKIIVHWHGIEMANAFDGTPVTQFPIEKDDSYTYRFQIVRSGIFWYHPHFNSLIQNVLGLQGGIVCEDAEFTTLRDAQIIPHEDRTFVISLYDIGFQSSTDSDNSVDDVASTTITTDATTVYMKDFDKLTGSGITNNWGDSVVVNGKALPVDGHSSTGANAFNTWNNLPTSNTVISGAAAVAPITVTASEGLGFYLINSGLHRYYRIKAILANSDTGIESGQRLDLWRIGGEGGLLHHARKEDGSMGGFHHQPISERTAGKATAGFGESEMLLPNSARTFIAVRIPDNAANNSVLYIVANGFNTVPAGWADNSPTDMIIAKFQVVDDGSPPLYTIDDLAGAGTGSPGSGTTLLAHDDVGKQLENLTDTVIHGIAAVGEVPVTSHPEADIEAGILASGFVVPATVQTDYVITLDASGGGGGPKINDLSVHFDATGPTQELKDNTKYLIKGELVEFTVENTSQVDHPWHQHGFSFQPIQIELIGNPTLTTPDVLYVWDHLEFVDVFTIPAYHKLTYRFRVEDRPFIDDANNFYYGGVNGRWLAHCHIFKHAHMGMMSSMVVMDSDYSIKMLEHDYSNPEASSYSDSYAAAYGDYTDSYEGGGSPGTGPIDDDVIYDSGDCVVSVTDILITDTAWWGRPYHPPGLTPQGHYIRKFACDMSADEWAATHNAFGIMCDSGIMHEINLWHRGPHNMHVHYSPLSVRFGSWHRDMLRYFEYRLHEANPCAILPVWNFEIERDPVLPVLSDATKFNFLHSITDMTVSPPTTYTPAAFTPGTNPLAPPGTLQTILNLTELEPMLAALQGLIHDDSHMFWGGAMTSTYNAAACLPFYGIHGMVDWVIFHWLTGTSSSTPPVSADKNCHLVIDTVGGAGHFFRAVGSPVTPIVDGDVVAAGAVEDNLWNWGLDPSQPSPLGGIVAGYEDHPPWSSKAFHSCDTRTPMLLSNWGSSSTTDYHPGYVYYDSVCGVTG